MNNFLNKYKESNSILKVTKKNLKYIESQDEIKFKKIGAAHVISSVKASLTGETTSNGRWSSPHTWLFIHLWDMQ
jgi:hypothetical protein